MVGLTKDFQKAKQLYTKKDLTGLRKFIYNLDTAALDSHGCHFKKWIQYL